MVPHIDLQQLAETLRSDGHPAIDVEGQAIPCVTAFKTIQSQAALFLLRPGQHIPAHTHTSIDDIFFGVEGRGRIRTWNAGGQPEDRHVEPGTLLAIPPETPHEVSCADDEFCYLLLQAPREQYDNISYDVQGGFALEH